MVEFLKFVLRDVTTFLGTLALILVTGMAIGCALSPLRGPRNMTYIDHSGEDEHED